MICGFTPRLFWSKVLPTEPGWYWLRNTRLTHVFLFWSDDFPLDPEAWRDTEFAGPIAEPKEPI